MLAKISSLTVSTIYLYVGSSPLLLLQGSYGRLGLGNSDSQSTLKEIGTFPPGTVIRRLASSRGSDGHSQAITSSGEVYSWGDGKSRILSLCPFLSLPSGAYEPAKERVTTMYAQVPSKYKFKRNTFQNNMESVRLLEMPIAIHTWIATPSSVHFDDFQIIRSFYLWLDVLCKTILLMHCVFSSFRKLW